MLEVENVRVALGGLGDILLGNNNNNNWTSTRLTDTIASVPYEYLV
jgi:hypothetical protein